MNLSPSLTHGFERLVLYVSENTIAFKKERTTTGKNTLISKRDTGEIFTYQDWDTSFPDKKHKVSIIYGLLGNVILNAGSYFVVITEADPVCEIRGSTIWKTRSFQLIRNAPNTMGINIRESGDDKKYVKLIESYLNGRDFYFSYNYDLSNVTGKQPAVLEIENCNSKFVFNQFLLNNFIKLSKKYAIDENSNALSFTLPIIQGFVQVKDFSINGNSLKLGLISRRCAARSGTRYHCRGGDEFGNVSNFVETEQILISSERIFSFVLLRGSIPIKWNQQLTMKYKPKLVVSNDREKNFEVMKNHFSSLISSYGKPLLVVNLTNKTGYEKPLAEEFARSVEFYDFPNDLKYFHFDFHHECKAFGWNRLDDLVGSLKKYFESFSYWECSNNFLSVFSRQTGVVRVNCVDSLDRTNVFLSIIVRCVLLKQLKQLNIVDAGVNDFSSFKFAQQTFKSIWADNGDTISHIYTGTAALKSDFTRTGKRTLVGLMSDGYKSIYRYFLNNYYDGDLHDATLLLSGSYQISKGKQSPFKNSMPISKYLVSRYFVNFRFLPGFSISLVFWHFI